jgi:benzylsuccinate CoA-transferase BbsE subunit/naphthyl-2-methylsuccinate CoA transferase subunit
MEMKDRAPVRITAPQAYLLGAQQAAAGSLFALYHRDLTGEGQWIDVSLQEAVLFTLTYYLPMFEQRKLIRMRSGAFFSTSRPQPLGTLKTRRMFQCRDGEICLAFQGGTRAAIKSSHTLVAWANDEGYALEIKDYQWEEWRSDSITQSEQEFLESQIIPFLLTKDKITLLEEAARRRILIAPVSTSADLIQNSQFSSRDFWVKIDHPELNDTLVYPGPAVNIPHCPLRIYRRAPAVGEHNLEVYKDELGLTDTDIEALRRGEVI